MSRGGGFTLWHISDFKKDFYKPREVGRYFGLSSRTISKHCHEGKIEDVILESGRRIIPKSEVVRVLDGRGLIDYSDKGRIDVVYARVSTHKQKERGDLDRQVDSLLVFSSKKSPKELEVFSDVGSGLNDNRKGLLKVMDLILRGKVDRVFISYKDRLTRFGFNYIEAVCSFFDTRIVVMSSELMDKSLEEELAEDLVSIIHSFSGKLYGLRGRVRNAVEDSLQDDGEG